MAIITTEEIIEATGGDLLCGNPTDSFSGVSIDSRTIEAGEIFFALRGPNFDGHDFLDDVLSKGFGVVIDSGYRPPHEGNIIIRVENTLKALQDLAHYLRIRRKIPVVAITGSNGKTTTKEMTCAILSKRFKVLKNEGNLNNYIGLPLSLTRLSPDDDVAVLELGMNSAGEIRKLCDIASPSHGIVTNIGSAHIGNFGGVDEIRNEKLEILNGLTHIVLNGDDDSLMEGYDTAVKSGKCDAELTTFSIKSDSGVKAENVSAFDSGSNFTLKLNNGESVAITLNINGLFNIYNALAASAVCISLGMTVEEIKTALESYRAFPMRFEVIKANNIAIINDSYNANPSSTEESLKELVRMGSNRRTVAFLGDMFELGEFSEREHKALGKTIAGLGVGVFVSVGELMGIAADEIRKNAKTADSGMPEVHEFKTADEACGRLNDIVKDGDVVLIKGSRAMGMEKIAEILGGKGVI